MTFQEIKLISNDSLLRKLILTFNDCDNTTAIVDCTKPKSFLRHPVGALTTFAHVYTASGLYWVTVWAQGVVPRSNKSEIFSSNVSVVVIVRPTLIDEVGSVFLLIPKSTYVDEPLHVIILIQNCSPDIHVTAVCDDDVVTRSMKTLTNVTVTLREIIESDQYRNRYCIAASSRPHSTNVNESTMYSRLEAVLVVRQDGEHRIRVTISRKDPEITDNSDRFSLNAVVEVRLRPTLADEVGAVVIVSRRPAYVDEPLEFLYAVQRPHAELEYRLNFDDGLQWSTVSANNMIHLPAWLNSSHLELRCHLRECFNCFLSAETIRD